VALRGRCPVCGRGALFASVLTVAASCKACGFSYAGYEQGDGPAFFAILIIGALVSIGAAIIEIKYAPAFWVHALVWVPFICVGTLLSLRWIKAAIIAIQYRTRSEDFGQ
jgi:uncharacterized protein (DUF983 family)